MSAAKRVEGFEFPQIYLRFQAKDKDSDELVNYWVQDMPEDRFEELVEFMTKHFLPYEVMCECKGVMNNPKSVESVKDIWRDMLKQKVTLVCFKEGCNDIIGANVLIVYTKGEKSSSLRGDRVFDNIMDVIDISEKEFDVFEHYGVESYLYGFGLAVHPAYRGKNIATEIIKARYPLMKTLNLTLTSTAFTGGASQAAAKKAGFKDDLVLVYADLHKYKEGLSFPGIKSQYFKIMSYTL